MNADDLGRSEAINAGILEAHRDGIVTSASLMVRWEAAAEAGEALREHPRLGVGLHLDLGEWIFRDGGWATVYEVTALEDEAAVEREARAQLARFIELTGRTPTHLDSHQHVHMREPARGVALRMAQEGGVPLRGCDPRIRYCGDFYGRGSLGEPLPHLITAAALSRLIDGIEDGVTELACHPGSDGVVDPAYGVERSREVAALTHPDVREALERNGIETATFATFAG